MSKEEMPFPVKPDPIDLNDQDTWTEAQILQYAKEASIKFAEWMLRPYVRDSIKRLTISDRTNEHIKYRFLYFSKELSFYELFDEYMRIDGNDAAHQREII